MMKLTSNQKGITLVALVMLIVFISIAVLGTTTFIVQRLAHLEAMQRRTAAINLAEAGVQGAIYSYRRRDLNRNGYFPLGQFNVNADQYFVLGGNESDMLMVDLSQASLIGPRSRAVGKLRIQNATNAKEIIIKRMVVVWDNSSRLRRITIGKTLVWSGKMRSPARCNLRRGGFVLDSIPNDYPLVLRFQSNMKGARVGVRFVMADDSSQDYRIYPSSNNFNFIVKSTGKTSGSDIHRTIQAEYNAITSRITDCREIDLEVTP